MNNLITIKKTNCNYLFEILITHECLKSLNENPGIDLRKNLASELLNIINSLKLKTNITPMIYVKGDGFENPAHYDKRYYISFNVSDKNKFNITADNQLKIFYELLNHLNTDDDLAFYYIKI